MKYIRTYDDYESYKAEYSDTSRGFRLKPTLYKYSEAGDHVHLEIDDPRKHEGSTYMEITLDSDVEFSFYIGNKSGDTQTTMNCSIDWGDGTVETKMINKDDKRFKLSHNYKAGSYSIELYAITGYSIVGGSYNSLISHINSIKRVVLGRGVVNIGGYAFYQCPSITSVYISEGVVNIEGYAFSGCTSLTTVYIPEGVTSIGESAFSGCPLTSIYIPKGVTSIERQAFNGCTSLTSVYIPKGVTSIGDLAFFYCPSLKSVYISDGVTNIGVNTFGQCPSLTSVNIPEGVTSIGNSVFNGCPLTSIHIPESVNSIGFGAFSSCTSLKSINFPESVTSIGNKAFRSCNSLKSISSLNTIAPTLGNYVFDYISKNGTLHIKPGATGYDAWLSKLPSGWTIVEDL